MNIMQAAVQDLFDVSFKDELEELYSTTVWSSLSDNMKNRMKTSLALDLKSNNIKVSYSFC